ncbi:uncharacterized protein C8Q71DRAFT_697301 [Rhodofomes roseus]|uniref:C2 domain-containing protein n=1 Tax=Rhodofomes roseus TaxID=34475 RepID=A0ABQ8KYD4_9APHY|nr:uncharacterized protein C8Q71DRAFT_697301 [Rhodofomes roseus]KAH9844063.1 hypothetical protein C8Q71DRAFT_697301 [Rhodofomes roseus]
MATTATSRDVGTLVVVVLKAKNLPNKRHIGKQDPYCSVTFNAEKKRTKAIKRGGQHPEWDEEFRYTLYEDPNDMTAPPPHGDGTPPPPPPKKNKGPPSVKGGRSMLVACYADDAREPDFIGETNVDLTEVLTKGETDEWFTLTNKDKYCGEVYLELTFWSNEPVPVKKVTGKPNGKSHKHYGGPGQFVPAGESPPHNSIDLRPEHVPPSLRPSSSRVDLYVPPYETSRSRHSMVDSVAGDFAELSVGHDVDRRLSFPPQQSGFASRPASSIGFQDQRAVSPQPGHDYHQGTYPDGGGNYYEGAATPPVANAYHQGPPPEQYQPPYETLQPAATGYQVVPRHGPRHTTPTPQNYGPPASHMLIPSSSFSTLPQPPIASSGFIATGPPPTPTPAPYHRSSRRQSSLPIPPAGGPPGMYNPSQRGPSGSFNLPPPPQTGPPATYNGSTLRAPSGSYTAQSQGALYTQPTGSSSHSYNLPPIQQTVYGSPGGVSPGEAPASLYSSIPPPPPLPSQTTPAPYATHGPQPPVAGTSPSLPPPPSQYQQAPMPSRSPSLPPPPQNITRRPSLPPPPTMGYASQPQSAFQALPPPPAPPSMPPNTHYESISSYMPVSGSQTFHPGPPPRPPAQLNGQPQYHQYSPNPQASYGGQSPIAERGW